MYIFYQQKKKTNERDEKKKFTFLEVTKVNKVKS